jgi:hypothetical protein
MKKPALALFLILMSLLIIAPKLWAQGLICEEANGLLWCYNDQACGQPCNEVCAVDGLQPIANNTVWLEAQDTEGECIAISQAFGLGGTVDFGDFELACVEDGRGTHTVGGGINTPITCSFFADCPERHRARMDQQGVPCGPNSRRSICPCEPPPPTNVPTLSEWGLIAMAGILGIIGFMVIRRRKVTA